MTTIPHPLYFPLCAFYLITLFLELSDCWELWSLEQAAFEVFIDTYEQVRNQIYVKALFIGCCGILLKLKPLRLWGMESLNVVCVVRYCQSTFLLGN